MCLLLMALIVCPAARGQLILNTGDTYTYQFNTLPRTGDTTLGIPSGMLGLNIPQSSLQPGDALRFEIFEGAPVGTPVLSRTVTESSEPVERLGIADGAWQDLQGSIRLTMISGSAVLENFAILAFTPAGPGGLNQYSLSIVPEPRPSMIIIAFPSGLSVRWPTSATNFVLEATPVLAPPVPWQPVTNTVEILNGMFAVTVDYQMPSRFLRLRKLTH